MPSYHLAKIKNPYLSYIISGFFLASENRRHREEPQSPCGLLRAWTERDISDTSPHFRNHATEEGANLFRPDRGLNPRPSESSRRFTKIGFDRRFWVNSSLHLCYRHTNHVTLHKQSSKMTEWSLPVSPAATAAVGPWIGPGNRQFLMYWTQRTDQSRRPDPGTVSPRPRLTPTVPQKSSVNSHSSYDRR